jgi:hypothetical protein
VMNEVIKLWSDMQIPPGSVWPQEISQALEGCDAPLLLETKDSFASEYLVQRELPFLRGKRKRVYWVATVLFTGTPSSTTSSVSTIRTPPSPRSPSVRGTLTLRVLATSS